MNPNSFDQTDNPPRKKGCGCLFNTLFGLAVLILVIVGGGWLLIMHSPLPLRFVTSLIEEGGADSNLKITGVSGSLASGLAFDKVEWDDGEITDMRFRYSGIMDVIRRDELIIHEMHIGSSTLDSGFFTDPPDESESQQEDESPSEDESAENPAPAAEASELPLRLLRIDRVSLNQIIIKNATTGHTITIPEIEWTGFKAEQGEDVQLGDLRADSDHVVIKTTTPSASDYQKRLDVTLLPKLDARILKPIRIVALVGEKDDEPIFDIMALDGTLTFVVAADGTQQLRATGANLADFLDAPLPNNLQLDAEAADPTLTVRGGSFLLGTKPFEIQPTTASGPDDEPEGTVFLAIHRAGGTEIRYEIPVTESKDQEQSFTPVLTSTPAMSSEDLMALLFHDQPFSALPPPDQLKLREHMSWFSFTP